MNDLVNQCPICDEGTLVPMRYQMEVTYKGHSDRVDGFQRSVCDHCGGELADSVQTRNNKRIVIAFHKRVDSLMSGEEIRSLRKRYDLSQEKASEIFGGGPVAFSKYEHDDVTQSASMDKLLRLASESEDAMQRLAQSAGVHLHLDEKLDASALRDLFRRSAKFTLPSHMAFTVKATRDVCLNRTLNDTNFENETEPSAA